MAGCGATIGHGITCNGDTGYTCGECSAKEVGRVRLSVAESENSTLRARVAELEVYEAFCAGFAGIPHVPSSPTAAKGMAHGAEVTAEYHENLAAIDLWRDRAKTAACRDTWSRWGTEDKGTGGGGG